MDFTASFSVKILALLAIYVTTAAAQTPTETSTQPSCIDAAPDCADYGTANICTPDYKTWALQNCRHYCGYCNEPPPCVDLDTDCASYGRENICTVEYEAWASINCAKFCGLCPAIGPGKKTKLENVKYRSIQFDLSFAGAANNGSAAGPAGSEGSQAGLPASVADLSMLSSSSNTSNSTLDECIDVEPDCVGYGSTDICTGVHETWALLHCRKFCNYCHIELPCEDALSDCFEYGKENICTGIYVPWSNIHCRRFCELCGTVSEASSLSTTATAEKGQSSDASTQSPVTSPSTAKP